MLFPASQHLGQEDMSQEDTGLDAPTLEGTLGPVPSLRNEHNLRLFVHFDVGLSLRDLYPFLRDSFLNVV
jgi:hypothetical protein